MILFICFIGIIILLISTKLLYNFIYNKIINKKITSTIENDINKKPFFISDKNLNNIKNLWTLNYLKNKFNNREITVANVENGILSPFEGVKNLNISSDIFFKLLQSSKKDKFYYAQNEMIDELKKDIIIPSEQKIYGKINDIVFWISGGNMFTPLHFDHDDGFLCVVKGIKHVKLINPKYTEKLKPYSSLIYCDYLDIDKSLDIPFLEYELREGDYLFIPAGWWHCVKSSPGLSIAYTLWLYQYEKKYNYDLILKKIEILQKRKIPKYIYPKTLKTDEIYKLFKINILDTKKYKNNFCFFNPLYTDIYD